MPNQKNKDAVEVIRKKVTKAKSIIFADFKGLKANDTNELRQKMRDADAEMGVSKNSLLKIALEKENIDTKDIKDTLNNSTVAIFSYSDALGAIKPLVEFIKRMDMPKIKSGIIDGKYTTSDEITVLSTLPSREELISKILGAMKSPVGGLANTFVGVQRKFVYAIKAIADNKK